MLLSRTLISNFISARPSFLLQQLNMSSTPTKLAKMTPYIGTHDMTFHCDDVTAVSMLKRLDRFKDHDIVRTRVQEVLDKADIVVDVGGVCDIEKLRLDHHQRSFMQTIRDYHPNIKVSNPNKPVRLSSAGLVYAVFGKDVIAKILDFDKTYDQMEDEDDKKMIDAIFDKAYIEMMEEIDAIDNGVDMATGDNVVYNYHISSGISSRVGRYNPNGKEATPEERLVQFKKAMELVGGEMAEGIQFLANTWWPARQKFRELVVKRKEFDPSGQLVLIADDYLVGWKSALVELEEELGIVGELKFIIYNDNSDVSPWRLLAVPLEPKSFRCRVPLKEEWCGKRDQELQEASGISDVTFVHMSGFTGGAKSLAGVKTMARLTLGLE